jgi:hypothetical protein
VLGADCNSTHTTCPEEENVTPVPSSSTESPSQTPSQVPSPVPSQTPSRVPTPVTTLSPSLIPSAVPSVFPSLSSSPTVSAIPTISSAPTQSNQPSRSASPSQEPTNSAYPSFSASPTVTAIPTQSSQPSQSFVPSQVPTVTALPSSAPTIFCSVDDDGSFGITSTTIENVQINFGYELVYQAASNFSLIGPDLESGINNGILPAIFSVACESTSNGDTLVANETLEGEIANYDGPPVVGISTFPKDQPIPDVPCLKAPPNGNKCLPIRGAITFYLESKEGEEPHDTSSRRRKLGTITNFLKSPADRGKSVLTRNGDNVTEDIRGQIKSQVSSDLKKAMKDGKYNNVHPDVVSVSYRDIDTIYPDYDPNSPGTDSVKEDDGGGVNYGLTFGLVAGAGALFALGAAVAYKRKRDVDAEEGYKADLSIAQTEV